MRVVFLHRIGQLFCRQRPRIVRCHNCDHLCCQRYCLPDHLFIFLICQHTHDKDQPLARQIPLYTVTEYPCCIPVVGAIHDKQRISGNGTEPSQPDCLLHTGFQCFLRYLIAFSLQLIQHFQCQCPVQKLIFSCKGDLHLRMFFVTEDLTFQSTLLDLYLLWLYTDQFTAFLLCFFPNRHSCFRLLACTDHCTSRLYDPCLMLGNLSQRIPKESHMIHTDGCQYSHLRIPDHICRIQSATHADFQYHQITVLFHKIKKCNGSLHLEHGRMLSAFCQKLVSCSLHLLCQPDQIFSGNIGFINLDPFPVTEDRWRNISSYFISGFLQNRRYISQHGTLPIGSCNMHKSQLILRISKQT